MSIDRNQLSDSVQEARKAGADAARTGREPPAREDIEQFRNVMQVRQEARDEFAAARGKGAARQAVTAEAVDAGRQPADDLGMGLQAKTDPAELLAMMQAQSALRDGAHMAQAPAAPAPANPAAFAELVERHVRQLAVGGNDVDERDGQVLLRMADATLPGTGWMLRADVRSRDSYDAIREAAPELARRFAERNLGVLEIDSQFHG